VECRTQTDSEENIHCIVLTESGESVKCVDLKILDKV
jgi:hypothetical protein